MSAARGFTLIELLVVILIIGLTLNLAVLALGDRGPGGDLASEARRLAELVRLAGEEAVLTGSPIGLETAADGYRFLDRDEQRWRPSNDPLFRARPLPDGLRLSAEGETPLLAPPVPAPEQIDAPDEQAPRPQVIFLPSGERSAFRLLLQARDDGAVAVLEGAELGPVALELE